jgi:hypothetical protein
VFEIGGGSDPIHRALRAAPLIAAELACAAWVDVTRATVRSYADGRQLYDLSACVPCDAHLQPGEVGLSAAVQAAAVPPAERVELIGRGGLLSDLAGEARSALAAGHALVSRVVG